MASLGQELRRERELRGISLKEISDSTKISLRYLRALEDDQLDVLPGKFFTRSIIRAYAQYCGLEEEVFINKYLEETQLQEQILEEERKKSQSKKSPSHAVRRLFPYALALVVLIPFVVSIYFLFIQNRRANISVNTQIPALSLVERSIPLPPDSFSARIFPKEKIHMDIFFVQKTWLRLYVDGRLIMNGLKYPGEKARIKASREILLHLGNAGGIAYSLNNAPGKSFGPSGAVVKNIRITPDNLTDFIVQKKGKMLSGTRTRS
ncbi:MAG: helix-turn-helix domain-containing protein [Candidatus Aminicenantales bacterium]